LATVRLFNDKRNEHRMKRLLIAASILLGLVAPAAAQTAEEAVAYIFLGLADGAKIVRGTTTMSWKESGGSPAVFEGDGNTAGHAYNLKFTITAEPDPCDYTITLEGPEDMVPQMKRLFAKVDFTRIDGVAISSDGFKAAVTGAGFCETGRVNPDCNWKDDPDLFGSVDLDRHSAAMQFIRTGVCTVRP
jgi:hypothetical protein